MEMFKTDVMHTVPLLLLIKYKNWWENGGKCAVCQGKECAGV